MEALFLTRVHMMPSIDPLETQMTLLKSRWTLIKSNLALTPPIPRAANLPSFTQKTSQSRLLPAIH